MNKKVVTSISASLPPSQTCTGVTIPMCWYKQNDDFCEAYQRYEVTARTGQCKMRCLRVFLSGSLLKADVINFVI